MMSAYSPAPPLGSDAANTSTMGGRSGMPGRSPDGGESGDSFKI
jgi:hypothetical protein